MNRKYKYYEFADCALIEKAWEDLRDGDGAELEQVSFTLPVISNSSYYYERAREVKFSFRRAQSVEDAFLLSKKTAVSGYGLTKRSGVLPEFISEDEYKALPPSFQKKYEKRMEPEVDVLTPVTESEKYELGFVSEETAGDYFSRKGKSPCISTYYDGDARRIFFVSDLSRAVNMEINALRNPRTILPPCGSGSVSINYLESDYDGATRKVYDRFKNGRPKSTFVLVKDYRAVDSLSLSTHTEEWRLENEDESVLERTLHKIAERLTFTQGEEGV